jgi:hypothetical protein
MECPKCGKKNPDELFFCENCTTPLKKKRSGSKSSKEIPPPPPPTQPTGQPYPYPPPEYRPSLYDGLYQLPKEEPRLRLDILPKVLFQPREAFMDIYQHTTKTQGIIVALIIVIIQSAFSIMIVSGTGIYIAGTFSAPGRSALAYAYFQYSIAIPLAILGLYLYGYFSAIISREMGGGRNDIDKTIGLLGYGAIVALVTGILALLIFSYALIPYDISDGLQQFFMSMGILVLFGLIAFVWGLWVNGCAVSVANDISVNRGILTYFVASLIGGIILGIIGFIIGLVGVFLFL